MFKEMTLRFSNDSELENPGEVATINQFIMNEYEYPDTDGQLNLFVPDTDGDHVLNFKFSRVLMMQSNDARRLFYLYT